MKAFLDWLYYSVLRVVVFAVPLTILLLLHITLWISVIAAAVIGLCLSYLLLGGPRKRLADSLYELRHRDHTPPSIDDDVEDGALDEAEHEQRAAARHPEDSAS